eukprot:TRINITY_DN2010_c0_g1_i6.p1 TRINITY_DN2010_c0_g1~~TRINITY_DN2010_c0_g1_i6.p1  ORF type:complete len:124 (+),score=34.96 TRINITY_DN2010_c0_g1_i6:38-409(+)
MVCDIVFFFFFFKQKTAYEMLRSLVGSEMCIRDRYQRRVRENDLNYGARLLCSCWVPARICAPARLSPQHADCVSKEHVRLSRGRDGKVQVSDLGSKHGTTLNGLELAPNTPRIVDPVQGRQW